MTKKKVNKNIETNKKTKKITGKKDEAVVIDNNIDSLWKIIIIIMITFAVFYVLTYFVAKNNKTYTWENKEESSVIQYDEILFGTMLSQSSEEYYVLALNYSDENKEIYDTYISMYGDKEGSLNFYTVNLSSDFNKKYIGENSNFENYKKLKVKDITLFKIKDSKIVEYVEGEEKIISKFKDLIK